MSIINARSPYFTSRTGTVGDDIDLKIYIWDGLSVAFPSSPEYTLTKSNISTTQVSFEISELIRDYLSNSYNGTYATDGVWVQWSFQNNGGPPTYSSLYFSLDGYSYFEDGINSRIDTGLLQSNNIVYRLNDSDVNIPVNTYRANSVAFWYNGIVKRTETITDSVDSAEQVGYITVSGGNAYGTFQSRILLNGGVYESNPCIDDFLKSEDIGLVDEIWVASDVGTEIIKVVTIDECKYEPYKVTFVNKFGALQDMWFFKRSDTSITTQSDSYKANILDLSSGVSYSTSDHQIRNFNKNGNETIVLNSGFYDEEYNEIVKQMLLSEQVWIDNGSEILPVNVNTNSYRFQKNVNDKLIQHTLEFSYAYDKINSVR